MESIAGEETNSDFEGSLAVDHALLESLFYNEMMMLNPTSPGPSSFLSQHFSEATHFRPHPSEIPTDPNTIAETEMLRDFGVSSSPMAPSTYGLHAPLETGSSTSSIARSWVTPPARHPQHAPFAPVGPAPSERSFHSHIYPTQLPPPSMYSSCPPEVSVKSTSAHTQILPLSVETSLPPSHNHSTDRAQLLVD